MRSKKPKPTTRLNKLRRLYTIVRKVDQAVYDASETLLELEKITMFIEQEMRREKGEEVQR
jgi:hypothetical protein